MNSVRVREHWTQTQTPHIYYIKIGYDLMYGNHRTKKLKTEKKKKTANDCQRKRITN